MSGQGMFRDDDLSVASLYSRDLDRYPLIETREEEHELALRARAGDEAARERLLTANLRFVIAVARQFARRCDVSLDELIAAGNLGLVSAVDRFDPDRGVKFITYAVSSIRQAVHSAIRGEELIPLSVGSFQRRIALKRCEERMRGRLGRAPTLAELAKAIGTSEEEVRILLGPGGNRPVSLQAPVPGAFEHHGRRVEDRVGDPQADPVQDVLQRAGLQEMEATFNEVLSKRERRILVLYYGLDHGESLTLEELAQLEAVTRERIRQIRNRALEKLRNARPDLAPLADWLVSAPRQAV